jgi:hypothetical protein
MARRSLAVSVSLLLTYFILLALPATAATHAKFSADPQPIFFDFDGDHKVDQAELLSNGAHKSIHVSLGKSAHKFLSFDSGVADRGRLVSDDIDLDGDEDLVWISQESPNTRVTWLGDGHGDFSILTGEAKERLLILFQSRFQHRIADDADDEETTYELQLASVPALDESSSVISLQRSQQFTTTPDSPHAAHAFFLTLPKRGPPSQLL